MSEVYKKAIALILLSLCTSSLRTRVLTRARCLGTANEGERLRVINRDALNAYTLIFTKIERELSSTWDERSLSLA